MIEAIKTLRARLEFIDTLKGIESISDQNLNLFEKFFENNLNIIKVIIQPITRMRRKKESVKRKK